MKPQLTLIAAMDEERLIANSKGIPWHLPRDVAHFREYTRDKWLLLGRKTYGQMRGWFREGHMPLVMTRRRDWEPERGALVSSVEEAMKMTEAAEQGELVCCGGGAIFAEAMPQADRMVLSFIRHRFPADEGAVYFPKWDEREWAVESRTDYPADAGNPYAMSVEFWARP